MNRAYQTVGFNYQPRRDQMYSDRREDPYFSEQKYPDNTLCPDCGALFQSGRWLWASPSPEAKTHEHRCPACQRVQDDQAAALLTLGGAFFQAHEEEILHLVANQEEKEKNLHPMERIMDIKGEQGKVIRFTGRHLARAVGESIQHAYKGLLNYEYTEKDNLFRVNWYRE